MVDARCHYEVCGVDLADSTQIAEMLALVRPAQRTLVLTEGLLVYLREDEVASMASAFHTEPSIGWWITDLACPRALVLMRSVWGALLKGASFLFAPENAGAFFGSRGWSEVDSDHLKTKRAA